MVKTIFIIIVSLFSSNLVDLILPSDLMPSLAGSASDKKALMLAF